MRCIKSGSLLSAAILVSLSGQVFAAEETLEEIVVTATKRAESTQNVAMSIAAVTNEVIEAQGLKTAQDLARVVPALVVPSTTGGGFVTSLTPPTITIRGINGGGTAPTTGIYLDDIPLGQRIVTSGGGGLLPQLFDLARVEVLRGPQGTLYGGSSEGGTLRFITPQANFDKVDAYVHGELAKVSQGSPNLEIGARVSGPIVSDKVAGLVTAWRRTEGGYIDHVSRFTGATIAKDTNGATHDVLHAALAFKPTDDFKATVSYFYFADDYKDADTIWNNMPATTATFGPVDGAHPNGVQYTLGPYNMWGPYKTGFNTNVGDNYYTSDGQLSPVYSLHYNFTRLPSLTLDWDMGPASVKLISSYLERYNVSIGSTAYTDMSGQACTWFGPFGIITPHQGGVLTNPVVPLNCGPTTSDFAPTVPVYNAPITTDGFLKGITEELRFSSNDANSAFGWIAGLYFNQTKLASNQALNGNDADFKLGYLGVASPIPSQTTLLINQHTDTVDKSLAAFGEASYKIGKLKLTGGLRYTRSSFDFRQEQVAPLFGITTPTIATGHVLEKPVTPKVGAQYMITDDNNVYLTASKGYRPGGTNVQPPPFCQPGLQAAGAVVPDAYGSDSLWNYELGSKNRFWNGKATFNASVFYIDWKDVQTALQLPQGACGWVDNAAKVISQGADLEFAALLFPGFTLSIQGAYTDAHYKGEIGFPNQLPLIKDGDDVIGNSKWSGNLSLSYEFDVLGSSRAYIRTDWQYKSSWKQSFGPGTLNYQPDAYTLGSTKYGSARLGVKVDSLDVSLFLNNITGSTDPLALNGLSGPYGRSGCADAACSSYQTYRAMGVGSTYAPRTFGVDVSYRY